jgi:hypothetical protein
VEVVGVHRQHVLEEVVRAWVEEALPGQTTVADQAVELVSMSCDSGAGPSSRSCRKLVSQGLLYSFFGIVLSPIIAAAAMALSSLSVVTNANRLRRFPITKTANDRSRST